MPVLYLLLTAVFLSAQTKPTIFLITDAEGVGGVCRQDQVEPSNREMQQLLTAEINAAVQGFLDGGAGVVIVWDGHDGSQTLSTLTIHPRAKLVMGGLNASMLMERKFSAVAIVGQHSKANIRAHHGAQLLLARDPDDEAQQQAVSDRRDRPGRAPGAHHHVVRRQEHGECGCAQSRFAAARKGWTYLHLGIDRQLCHDPRRRTT
jgi:hypothetical protein